MKTYRWFIICLVMLLALLAGCGQTAADPNVPSADPTDAAVEPTPSAEPTPSDLPLPYADPSGAPVEPTPSDEPAPSAEPTPSDEAYFQALLSGSSEDGWYNAAMGSIYDTPEEMDIDLVFYFGLPGGDEWEDFTAEEEAYLISQGFARDMDADKMPAERINEVLTEYFGITLSDVQISDEWVYYEETDSYYNNHNDAYRVHGFTVTEVRYGEDGLVQIYYTVEVGRGVLDPVAGEFVTEAVLTLREKAEGGYLVISNQDLKWEGFS